MNKPLPDAIEDFLRSHPGQAYKTKELARLMGLPKQGDDYQRFKTALRTLSARGSIARVYGQRWAAPMMLGDGTAGSPTDPGISQAHGVSTDASRTLPPGASQSHASRASRAHGSPSPSGATSRQTRSRRETTPERSSAPASGSGGRQRRLERDATRRKTTGRSAAALPPDQRHYEQGMEVVGTLLQPGAHAVVRPAGKNPMPDVLIRKSDRNGASEGDRVVVEITDPWGPGLPHGVVLEVLGREGAPGVELETIARRFGLSLSFPPEVEEEAALIPARIPKDEIARRLDLRATRCFTIDPADARDHDDAVSLEQDADGNYLLGVHIADVSHYVRPGTALDREAYARGTSVYLVTGAIPMLPERLSNSLCSLEEGRDRLAYSVLMTVREDGTVLRSAMHKTVIRAAKSYTYEQVQAIIDSGKGTNAATLRMMGRLARTLTKRRLAEGAIDFDVPEVRIELGADDTPAAIVPRVRLDSMRLIEEFMLLANRTVAEVVKQLAGRDRVLPFLYRIHDMPDPDKVRELTTFLSHVGIRVILDPKSSHSFQRMLESLGDAPESPVIQDLTIRTMAKAIYSEKNIGHFGLAFPRYTHFTSPIRRYPDLIVHRLLEAHLRGGTPPHGISDLAVMARQSSERERLAMEAERESVRVMELAYMQRHLGEELEGVISSVTAWGLYVEIIDILVEGLVHVRSLEEDFFRFDPDRRALIGRRSGKMYQLGDRIRVQVARIDPVDRHIDFIPA